MITKFLEAFFRHKLLVLLPPVLIPLIVGPYALVTAPIYYESWAGIWVDKPQYLAYSDFSPYSSPASQQSNRLVEVMRTRSFITDVAKRTSLAPLVGNSRGEERINSVIGTGFTMIPNGDHLLVLHFKADNPRLAFDMLNAIIDTFKENAATDRVNQASLAISFYQGRLQTAQEELKSTTTSVRQYTAANPNLASLNLDRAGSSEFLLPPQVSDPQLADMMGKLKSNQAQVEALRAALETAQFDASAGLEGQELGFQTIDPPQLPTGPTRALRKQLVYPIAGLVAGMALSLVILVLFVAADRSVRSESDLPEGARLLGAVPQLNLKLKRLPKAARRDAMRRAIGFVAGTALPAPTGSK